MQNDETTAAQLIARLGLEPLHGEGGLFRQTYRSGLTLPAAALPAAYGGLEKPCATAILYMLTAEADSFSALHRLKTDEIYHFYLGDPLEMTLLLPDGSSRRLVLGPDILGGQHVQVVVPAGVWQGSRLAPGGRYALLGTTMAPGFTPEDFELGRRADLLAAWPQERERILDLTRG